MKYYRYVAARPNVDNFSYNVWSMAGIIIYDEESEVSIFGAEFQFSLGDDQMCFLYIFER